MLRGHKDLRVFQQAYKLAMRIFHETKHFPPEERYALTDQIRRSSRSITANIAEGFRKRQYPNAFVSKLADADGEGAETQVWIDYARDCGYWSTELAAELTAGYEEVGRMLGGMMAHPEKFARCNSAFCLLPSAFCLLPSASGGPGPGGEGVGLQRS